MKKYLAIILLVAAILRFAGIYPGYNLYHSDEPIIYGVAANMIRNDTMDPGRYDYPGGTIYINYFAYKFLFIPLYWSKHYISQLPNILSGRYVMFNEVQSISYLNNNILTVRNTNPLVWGRVITATFGVGNVLLIYLLGKKMFRKEVGLIAALLLAFNFKSVVNSHITLPDIYNSFFLVLSVIASYNLLKNSSRRNYFFAGIAVGVSISMKYQIYAAFPFAFSHFYITFVKDGVKIKRLWSPGFIMASLLVPITFLILNPYFFINIETALNWMVSTSKKYQMGKDKLSFFLLNFMLNFDYGIVQTLAFVGGFFLVFLKFKKQFFSLLGLVLFFVFMFFYYSNGGFYVRNLITISPFAMLFIAVLLWEAINRLSRFGKITSKLITIIILTTVLFVPAKNSIASTYYYTKPWDYDLASDWMRQNLPGDIKIAARPWDLPTGYPKQTKTEFELFGSYSMKEHQEDGADYTLWNFIAHNVPFYYWMNIGTEDLSYLYSKPYDYLRNTFFGVATEELIRHSVFIASKPGVAADHTIIISKMPSWPAVNYQEINKYSFDSDSEGWKIYGFSLDGQEKYYFDPSMGFNSPGSLKMEMYASSLSVKRIVSPLVKVKPGYLYKTTSQMKAAKELTSKERAGYMRLDFYTNDNPNLGEKGVVSSVSSRVYGSNDWQEKEIVERAPEEAKYLTVSFQAYTTNKTDLWLDDVTIFESDSTVDDVAGRPYYDLINPPLDSIYPNSHGNL